MRANLTPAIEDYLKAIYLLAEENERVSTNQIAERMGVAPASVTGMLQKMAAASPPLVEYQKHHGVVLTPQGRTVALEIIRHHRLLELYLQKELGYSWDEVHGEADRLEHVISEEFEERIAQMLGDPQRDPHGELIPSRDFQLPSDSALRLFDLRPGERAAVQRMGDTDPDILRYLSSLGLEPGAELTVLEHSAYDDNLRLQVAGQPGPVVLGPPITRQIYMEVL